MNRTSKGSSYLAGVLDFIRGKPRKITSTTARKSAAQGISKQKQARSTEEHPYRAAEIACDQGACAAAIAIAEKRFLLREVPRIPLADCTSRKCTCTYVRYKDRRSWTTNRRAEFSMHTRLYANHGNGDRRRRLGRRVDDANSAADFDFNNWA